MVSHHCSDEETEAWREEARSSRRCCLLETQLGPFYSLRNPHASDLNKGDPQDEGREESL